MKFLKILFICAFATTLAGSAWSQSANPFPGQEIVGYLNSSTNTFRPLYLQSAAGLATAPEAVTVASGKITVNFTITIGSSIAPTSPIACMVNASVNDTNLTTFVTSNTIVEEATTLATRSGVTAKCTVTFAYSWPLVNIKTDKAMLAYSITTGTSGIANSTTSVNPRYSLQTIATIPIPAKGATTTETVAATI
jgi:hypothetical protein